MLPREFFVVAHRGASAYEPENTIPAVVKAIELKAAVVEVDVRRCKSGELVVFHDEDLSRLFNVNARLADLTLADLRKYKVGGRADIPTLNEVLEVAKGRIKLFIEIKERGLEQSVINLIKEYGLIDDVAVISFYLDVLINARKFEPRICTGYITVHPYVNVGKLISEGIKVLLPRHNLVTGRLVKESKARGLRVIPWVVNDVALAIKLRNLGVDGIATDKPDILTQMSKLI